MKVVEAVSFLVSVPETTIVKVPTSVDLGVPLKVKSLVLKTNHDGTFVIL